MDALITNPVSTNNNGEGIEGRLPLKTYLICGFLGAGKTTFILEYLRGEGLSKSVDSNKNAGSSKNEGHNESAGVSRNADSSRRASPNVAVLVNEFGKLGIDGKTIQVKGGVDVVEMPGGCVCCSQKQGLIKSIKDIAGHVKPDLLLIEPSGVAETSELLKTLSGRSLEDTVRLDAVVTVIDAMTFLEFSEPEAFGTFFLDQVENADVVLINKVDLVDVLEAEAVEKRVQEINPQAVVVKTEYCSMETALPDGRLSDEGRRGRCYESPQESVISVTTSPTRSMKFDALSIEPKHELSNQALNDFLVRLANGNFGDILRVKGFLNIKNYGCVSVQLTPGGTSVELIGQQLSSCLTLIGNDLRRDSIIDYFKDEDYT